jgi:hypothetical protein
MKWMSLPLVLLLSLLSASAAQGVVRKANARTLLGLAETGLSQTVRAAQVSSGRLDRSRPEQRPFWNALDKMGPALQRVRAGMAARDSSFFRALEDGSADLAELKVVWARTGVSDAAVSGALRVLSTSYGLLRTGYGREAVRHRMGLGLMPAERARFLRIQRTQERLAQVLRDLEERARQRGDEAMRAELRRMAEEAWRIASAQLTLDAYLNALMIADAQRGEWTANTHYASTDDRSEWLEAGAVVEELYVEADIGQVFIVDLGDVQEPEPAAPPTPSTPGTLAPPTIPVATVAPSAMSYLDEPTEVPEELAQAVETYQPASEATYLVDEVDPVEEEEAFAEEEMADETGAEEGSDLAIYEDIEDPDAAAASEELSEELSEEPEKAGDESEVEAEDLPIAEETAVSAPKPEDATAAPAAKPEAKKETAKTDKPAPQPKKKSAKPPA